MILIPGNVPYLKITNQSLTKITQKLNPPHQNFIFKTTFCIITAHNTQPNPQKHNFARTKRIQLRTQNKPDPSQQAEAEQQRWGSHPWTGQASPSAGSGWNPPSRIRLLLHPWTSWTNSTSLCTATCCTQNQRQWQQCETTSFLISPRMMICGVASWWGDPPWWRGVRGLGSPAWEGHWQRLWCCMLWVPLRRLWGLWRTNCHTPFSSSFWCHFGRRSKRVGE